MCLLYISVHDGAWEETDAHMFTTIVSINSRPGEGDMDYAIQCHMAYFCQEGMFVLLMIKFPSPQITASVS